MTDIHDHINELTSGRTHRQPSARSGRMGTAPRGAVTPPRSLTRPDRLHRPEGSVKPTRTCSIPGCGRKHRGRGYCRVHLERLNRTGDPGGPEIQLKNLYAACSVDGCERSHYAKGYCRGHWERVAKTGAPGSASLVRKKTTDYITFHGELRKKRGSASAHACVDCDGPAKHWSYNHSGIGEITSTHATTSKPVTFSLDMAEYEPRCARCHYWFDAAHRKAVA